MLDKRVEVLFERSEYEQLSAVARRQKKSVGQLLREAAAEKYLGPADQQRQAALQKLVGQTDDLGTWEDLKQLLSHRADLR